MVNGSIEFKRGFYRGGHIDADIFYTLQFLYKIYIMNIRDYNSQQEYSKETYFSFWKLMKLNCC